MIFQSVQRSLVILGISKTQSFHSFYGRIFIGYLLLSINVIEHFIFVFRDDITFEEQADSFYMTTMASMCFLCYTNMFLKKKEYYEVIDTFETVIRLFSESESKCYYFQIEINM